MNFQSELFNEQDIGAYITDDAAELEKIFAPQCAAVVWQREMPSKVQSWLTDIDPQQLPLGRVTFASKRADDTIWRLFDTAKVAIGDECRWLQNDIVKLANLFSNLMKAPYLRLRLEAVTTNACRKFHVDAVGARLVCTYRGHGTQYGLSKNGDDPENIFSAHTGWPIILRGTKWPNDPPSALRHRSPPIEGTGETRLVLVLDSVTDQNEI